MTHNVVINFDAIAQFVDSPHFLFPFSNFSFILNQNFPIVVSARFSYFKCVFQFIALNVILYLTNLFPLLDIFVLLSDSHDCICCGLSHEYFLTCFPSHLLSPLCSNSIKNVLNANDTFFPIHGQVSNTCFCSPYHSSLISFSTSSYNFLIIASIISI